MEVLNGALENEQASTEGQLLLRSNGGITTPYSAHNLGFIIDKHLTFSDQISSLSILLLSSATPIFAPKTARANLQQCTPSTMLQN